MLVYTSCKKPSHPTNPTPDDYRMLSYTKVTSVTNVIPPTIVPIISENYRFEYYLDKIATIFFTSNDQSKVLTGMAHLKIQFYYINDSIYKTSTDLNTGTIKERDTFLINPQGQIIHAYFPNEVRHFTYFGKLIARETVIYRDTGTAIQADFTYTADQGNFLNRLWNNTLTVNFPDSGIAPPTLPYIRHDTVLSLPINIVWTKTSPVTLPSVTEHLNHNSKSDQLSGDFPYGVTVTGVDVNGVSARPVYFPAGHTSKEFFEYYDELDNRPGDYMQIESLTRYGQNIYPNDHLFYSTSSPHNTTRVVYDIDADSKITHINATTKDSLTKNLLNVQYKLQWETH